MASPLPVHKARPRRLEREDCADQDPDSEKRNGRFRLAAHVVTPILPAGGVERTPATMNRIRMLEDAHRTAMAYQGAAIMMAAAFAFVFFLIGLGR
eukprot:882933-Amphidinium_carterae.1